VVACPPPPVEDRLPAPGTRRKQTPKNTTPLVDKRRDDRSPLALAYGWAMRITSISLEMVVPGLIGLWIDRQLGTVLLFLVLGVIVGVTTGMLHLVRLAAAASRRGPSPRTSSDNHLNQRPNERPKTTP
jgi:F0F1-type ATP synthase assembly protein I